MAFLPSFDETAGDGPGFSTPERKSWLGVPADALAKIKRIAQLAAPHSPSVALAEALIGDIPEALDKLSYGERISTGKGETWRPEQGAVDLAGLLPLGKAAATAKALGGLMAAGIVGGEGARMAPLLKLARAKELSAAGATREQVLEHTGWWQGKDQKWRFEIPDERARVELPLTSPGGVEHTTVGAVLHHPELFQQYPDLQNIPLQYRAETPGVGAPRAGYSREIDSAFLRSQDSYEGVRSLLHEMQHAVQNREGFAGGGSPAEIQKKFSDLTLEEAVEAYRRLAGEVEARQVARRAALDEVQRKALVPWNGDVPEALQTLVPRPLKQLP